MKTKILMLTIFIFCFLSSHCFAQFNVNIIGSRGIALGKTFASLNDFWSALANQAGLIQQKKVTVGMAVSNEFLVKELSNKALGCVIPIPKAGSFGILYRHFGYSEYSEQKMGLAYAKGFGDKLSIGIQFDCLFSFVNHNEYPNKSFFTFEFGMQYLLSKSLTFGIHAFNPISVKRSTYQNEHIPAILRIGISYFFSPDLLSIVEVEKDIQEKECLNIGLEYKLTSFFFIRIGLATNPVIYSFGVGTDFKKWKLNISSTTHPVLGTSPQFSATCSF